MKAHFKGKKIVITGGASGLGQLCARMIGEQGGEIILLDINRPGLDRTLGVLIADDIACASYLCNMSDFDQIEQVSRRILEDHGFVDILINCAGIVTGKPFGKFSMEEAELSFQVNTLGPMALIRQFFPSWERANRGHVVNIASAAGLIGCANLTDYCGTKYAVVGFNEALRVELRRRKLKIKTTVVCPFFIDTGMFQGVKTRIPLLLPILKEERVARRIVRAVRKEKKQLIMPPIVHTIPLLRFFPPAVLDGISNLLGVNHCMDRFVGRRAEQGDEVKG